MRPVCKNHGSIKRGGDSLCYLPLFPPFKFQLFTLDLRSSLLTLDNAQMRFVIVLAYSQPSPYMHSMQDVVPSAVSAAVSIDTMI